MDEGTRRHGQGEGEGEGRKRKREIGGERQEGERERIGRDGERKRKWVRREGEEEGERHRPTQTSKHSSKHAVAPDLGRTTAAATGRRNASMFSSTRQRGLSSPAEKKTNII